MDLSKSQIEVLHGIAADVDHDRPFVVERTNLGSDQPGQTIAVRERNHPVAGWGPTVLIAQDGKTAQLNEDGTIEAFAPLAH